MILHRTLVTFAAASLCLAHAGASLAHEYKVGAIVIDHPWSRATPPGARVAGGYLKIENTGAEDDALLSATLEISGSGSIHATSIVDGVASMRPVDGGLPLPAGETVELKPGAIHLMFEGIARPLAEGEEIGGTLTFAKAGTVEVRYAVGPIAESDQHTHDSAGQ